MIDPVPLSPAALAVAPPGPQVAAALALLDPAAVDGAAQVDLLVAWERLARWAAAGQARTLAALAQQRGMGRSSLSDEDVYAEVGAALAVSPRAAAGLVQGARSLRGRLPAVWRALADGRLSATLARITVEETDAADPAVCAAVDAALEAEIDTLTADPDGDRDAEGDGADGDSGTAGTGMVGLPPARWRTRVRRTVLTAAPGQAAVRAARAAANRRVELWPGPDATASLVAVLPAADALRVDGHSTRSPSAPAPTTTGPRTPAAPTRSSPPS